MNRPTKALFILCVLTSGSRAFGDAGRFEGRWTDPEPHDIRAVEIRNVSGFLRLRVFGRCVPQDCDWGEVGVQTYARGVDGKFKETVEALSAEYLTGFSRTLVILYLAEPDRLRVEKFVVFTDSSGRLPYHKVQILQRATRPEGTSGLGQPVQLSPSNGSVFSVYPRQTTLCWSAVHGAVRYGVDVDCLGCCSLDRWCSDVAGKWSSNVVDSPTYTFDFVGAQPGRWRVWAIGPSGEAGPKTGWWDFRYTR